MVGPWDPDAVFYPLLGRNSKTWASLFLSSGTTSLSTSEHQTSHFALGRLSVNRGSASPKVTHLPQGDPQQNENTSGNSGRLLPPREVGKGPPWRPWRAAVGRAYLAEIERSLLPVGSGSR